MNNNEKYWTDYYLTHEPQEPSDFAQWVRPRIIGVHVFDVGCGDGRDTLYLHEKVWTRGFDPACPRTEPEFERLGWRMMLRKYPPTGYDTLYARWLFHAMPPAEVEALLRKWRGQLFAEMRVEPVEGDDTHYRNPMSPAYVEELLEVCGYEIEYLATGRGWSKQGSDDPKLLRVEARK